MPHLCSREDVRSQAGRGGRSDHAHSEEPKRPRSQIRVVPVRDSAEPVSGCGPRGTSEREVTPECQLAANPRAAARIRRQTADSVRLASSISDGWLSTDRPYLLASSRLGIFVPDDTYRRFLARWVATSAQGTVTLFRDRRARNAESGVGRGPDRGVGGEARIGRPGAAISERPSPARISASHAPGSASTINSTASKGARRAPWRWCRPARNPGEL